MVSQPRVESASESPNNVILTTWATYLPPFPEYSTTITCSPDTGINFEREPRPEFSITASIQNSEGERVEYSTPFVTHKETLTLSLDALSAVSGNTSGQPCFLDVQFPNDVPIQIYVGSVHQATGNYLSYPILMYRGDTIFPHGDIMESTVFMPGLIHSVAQETAFIVINPYSTSFLCQLHLFEHGEKRSSSKPYKITPYELRTFRLEEYFPDILSEEGKSLTACVSAQYKILVYGVVKDRSTGAIQGIDHLHPYRL